MKKFISGLIVGMVIMTSVPAFAETSETINVIFGRVKLVVNNEVIPQQTLLYKGTTYVPLRTVAVALDKEVSYDENTHTAFIDENGTGRDFDNNNDTASSDYNFTYSTKLTRPERIILYNRQLEVVRIITEKFNRGLKYTNEGSYNDAIKIYCETIENSQMIQALDLRIISDEFDTAMNDFTAYMIEAAKEGILAAEAFSSNNIAAGEEHMKNVEIYLEKAKTCSDRITEMGDSIIFQ